MDFLTIGLHISFNPDFHFIFASKGHRQIFIYRKLFKEIELNLESIPAERTIKSAQKEYLLICDLRTKNDDKDIL